MKAELLDILNDFLHILEKDIFSFSHKQERELLDILLYNIPNDYKISCIHQIDKHPLNSDDIQVISKTIERYITEFVNDFISKY